MAPFQWLNIFKRRGSVQLKHQIDLGYGFRTIAILSSVFGQLLNFPPVQIRRFSVVYFIVRAYTITVNLFVTVFSIGAACSMFHHLSEFSKAAYFAAGFLGVTECLLRLLFILFKRNKIEKLMIQLQNLIKQSDFRLSQPAILTRISHYIVAMIVILLTMYISALVVNYVAVSKELHDVSTVVNATSKYFLKDITTELLQVYTSEEVSPSTMSIYMLMVYAISFMGVGKVVVSDVMFYACYWLVIEELELLARGLEGAICRSNSFEHCDELETWINFHHSVTRILHNVNDIACPAITIAVVFSTLQMCLVAFVIVKRYLDPSNALSIILFGVMSLHQLVMYCILGQRIREKVSRLQVSAYRSSWLGSRRATQHAALMICSAATERGMALPGAPFFALSLEFFASIMGAVFTYFIVLIQVNK